MSEIAVGDLVQWKTGDALRAGVVQSVNADGTCTVSRQTKSGRETVSIRTGRLERIASTTESAD